MGATFKKILPANVNKNAFHFEFLNELDAIGREMVKDLEATTATWGQKPSFDYEVDVRPVLSVFAGLRVSVGTSAGGSSPEAIWEMLNEGTGPHLIRAVKAPVLKFRTGYVAKTIPMVLSSRSGGAEGKWRSKVEVHHPGTEPRNWDQALKKKWDGPYRERMRGAMARGADKSGHRM